MKIATWNVNSVKARLDSVLTWMKQAEPDVAGFQEIKCVDDAFPRFEFDAMGYKAETHGQKTYNGVALLSNASDRGRDARPAASPTSRRTISRR